METTRQKKQLDLNEVVPDFEAAVTQGKTKLSDFKRALFAGRNSRKKLKHKR